MTVEEPVWLPVDVLLAIHRESIERFGGAQGTSDLGLLEPACDRARNRFLYDGADIMELAAAYCFGLCRNHPFVDGNKRIAFIAAFVFLDLNGWYLDAPESEAYEAVMAVASGVWDEPALANWTAQWARPAED